MKLNNIEKILIVSLFILILISLFDLFESQIFNISKGLLFIGFVIFSFKRFQYSSILISVILFIVALNIDLYQIQKGITSDITLMATSTMMKNVGGILFILILLKVFKKNWLYKKYNVKKGFLIISGLVFLTIVVQSYYYFI
mgnify:CR=1 FL=1